VVEEFQKRPIRNLDRAVRPSRGRQRLRDANSFGAGRLRIEKGYTVDAGPERAPFRDVER